VIVAGGAFAPFAEQLRRLGLQDRVIVREDAGDVEDYLQATDLGLYTSESESFCLSILEGMWFGRPAAAMRVGGIPEVIDDGLTGSLVPFGDVDALAASVRDLIDHPNYRVALGTAAQTAARTRFCPRVIVPQYEALYRRLLPPLIHKPASLANGPFFPGTRGQAGP
jgi:L-malate glycosyltransferase